MGIEVRVGPDWNVAILEINPDAWDVMVKVKVSYTGKESDVLFVTGLRKCNNFHLPIPQPFWDV